jgi:hypothetical protein
MLQAICIQYTLSIRKFKPRNIPTHPLALNTLYKGVLPYRISATRYYSPHDWTPPPMIFSMIPTLAGYGGYFPQSPASLPNPAYQNMRRTPPVIEKHPRVAVAPQGFDVNLQYPLPVVPDLKERPIAHVLTAPLPFIPAPSPDPPPEQTPHPLQRYSRSPAFMDEPEQQPVSTLSPDQILRKAPNTRPDRPYFSSEPHLSSYIESNQQPAPYPNLPLNEGGGGGGE